MTTTVLDEVKPTADRKARKAKKARPPQLPGTRGPRSTAVRTVKYVLLLFFLIIVLIPAYVLFVTSFKTGADISPDTAWSLPENWDTAGWERAWSTLSDSFWRTFGLVIPASLISAFLGSMNGFVLSRWRFRGADLVFTLILFGMFIPYQAVMIPLVEIMNTVGAERGIPSLIFIHVVYGLPICTLIFRNYYASVPTEVIESAKVDGAGMIRTYTSIVLPVSIPGFVVTIIWQFTSVWNDYLFAMFFSSAQNGPVTIGLNFLAAGQLQDYAASMAGALIASLPTLLVYIVLGRWFVGGLMAGSVKG
ncbi:carbohydrate ABC transporter permease [Thermocrispum municipale]|jgi:glucose/mannose transport system permease protein|uniref:carbohydrate ABC transporter permease n=1 Tax=Thermocrispum municipale TaxID=37926 RepID=UPI000423F919|nr:carbohydrate ABC transporter permease [Thermocrispum municipale]